MLPHACAGVMARATPTPGWGPADEGRRDGTSAFDTVRRAWFAATGAWPRRWTYAAAAERAGPAEGDVGMKLLPAPGSSAARLIGGAGVIPRSAGIYQRATPVRGDEDGGGDGAGSDTDSGAQTEKYPPLAVMVGWFNAQKRHVDKHLELYRPLASSPHGWDVLWFPVPAYSCLIPYGGYKLAEKILGILELLLVHPRPLVLHLISGGAYIFACCCDLMRHLPHGGPLPASLGLVSATPCANAYRPRSINLSPTADQLCTELPYCVSTADRSPLRGAGTSRSVPTCAASCTIRLSAWLGSATQCAVSSVCHRCVAFPAAPTVPPHGKPMSPRSCTI